MLRASGLLRMQKRERGYNMPGCNEAVTNSRARRVAARIGNRVGRVAPDGPQAVIATTVIMCAPPESRDEMADVNTLVAPRSSNGVANTPSRGEWAFTCSDSSNWAAEIVSSGALPYSNAVPVFTNMGGVPKTSINKMRFAGIITNPSMNHVDESMPDNWGAIHSSGAVTGNNTGPEYIPPMTMVYASPYPWTRTDEKNQTAPGFMNPGWIKPNGHHIDKYQPSTLPLRNADVPAFFASIENSLNEMAKEDNCISNAKSNLAKLGIEMSMPAFLYAQVYLYQARCAYLFQEWMNQKVSGSAAAAASLAKLETAIAVAVKKINEYWTDTSQQQQQMAAAMGTAEIGPRAALVPDYDKSKHKPAEFLLGLSSSFWEIYKLQFAEQCNMIRNFGMGRSRYGSPSEGMLDMMIGVCLR